MGKNREQKYTGSYEQVAKIFFQAATDKLFSMKQFFKLVTMNYLLRNGDAHLKNFGVLYDEDISTIKTMRNYIDGNPAFSVIGNRMIDAWTVSLKQTTYGVMPDDVIRTW